MDVDDEMHEEFQRLGTLRGRGPARGKHAAEPFDRREHVALGRMDERRDRSVIGDVHIMPGRRFAPSRDRSDPIRPESELAQTIALAELGYGRARTAAQTRLRREAGDQVTFRSVGPRAERRQRDQCRDERTKDGAFGVHRCKNKPMRTRGA